MSLEPNPAISQRFRGYLPVVMDLETGGFNASTDALLEIAATILRLDDDGRIAPAETLHYHVKPFEGANIEKAALEVTGIDPHHPFRMALDEEEALRKVFAAVRAEVKATSCTRAILVAHNAWFDQSFINAAVERTGLKRNPFHPFSSFDTATLAGVAYGQTVLSRAVQASGQRWSGEDAHSAKYDTEKTAELFCQIVNDMAPIYQRNLDAAGGGTSHGS